MATDTGFTQINDITLQIPPESIQVNRSSFNHEWQTLRTRSSTKVKSGFSQIDISMTCKFTDDPIAVPSGRIYNGLRKLRNLVSQFRVTPFCYIENEFLRNSILGGDRSTNMALALVQMEISKTDDTTNVVTVTFNFAWFNYFPYAKNFTFKRDIFVGDEVANPNNSEAWRLLYKAEQHRTKYAVVDQLKTFTRLTYNEFASLQVKDYDRLKKEVTALEKLKGELNSSGNNDDTGDVSERVKEVINRELANEIWATSLIREIFGDQTSMNGSNDVGQANEEDVRKAVVRVIEGNLKSSNDGPGRYDLIVNSEWKPIVLGDGKLVVFKDDPTLRANQQEGFEKSNTVMMRRSRSLAMENNDILTTGITISFENILATLPMIGHAFPTFQHIGSIDARISISMITTSADAVKKLSALYSSVEEQARRFRTVPAGQRNVLIDNDLINMCGIRDTIPDSMSLDTVPGMPGTTAAVLVLVNNPITADTSERFVSEGSFSSGGDLRQKIARILENNLGLINNAFSTDNQGNVELRGLKSPELIFGNSPDVDPDTHRRITIVTGVKDPGESGYYQFTGSKSDQNQLFRNLCEDYGRQLGKLLANVFPMVKTVTQNPIATVNEMSSEEHRGAEDFFLLKNGDVISVERLQDDVLKVIDFSSARKTLDRLKQEFPNAPILGPVEQRLAKTEAYFKIQNAIRDAKNFTGPLSADQETVLSEATEKAASFRVDDRITILLNTYFADWMTFSNNFLDKILYTGWVNLPEFQDVRDAMTEKSLQSTTGAYPDFPLDELVGLMKEAKGGNLKHSFRRLKDLFENTGLALKNVGMSVLINPDFFFFNAQNDVLETIIPTTVMKAAASSIIAARKEMEPAERDWFQGVYKKSILGKEKYARTSALLEEGYSEPGFAAFMKTKVGALYHEKQSKSYLELAVVANGLTGSVGPSLAEAANLPDTQKDGKETVGKNFISIEETNASLDKQNTRSNYNSKTQLMPMEGAYSVRHRFDTVAVLSELPEAQYLPKKFDPSKVPVLSWPTPSWCQRITSRFGPRAQPVAGASTNHPGLDISLNVKPKGQGIDACAGTPVLAAADGIINSAKFLPNFGVIIQVKHDGGCTTRYVHLALDDKATNWINILNRQGAVEIDNAGYDAASLDQTLADSLLTVRQGDTIGQVGPTAPVSTAAHLHFELYLGGQKQDPEPYLTGDAYKSQGPIKGIEPQNDSVLSKSVQQFEKDLRKGQGFTMMRAFPTFKLYFIETDSGERKRYGFDDFFSYSAIKDIQVIRSRKIAADLCVIQMTNISGVLSNRKFSNSTDPTAPKGTDGRNAKEENPIASMMLQPGVQIQLRLGYSNNPEELDTVFNGNITEVEFTETDDLVTIVCQSFATELVQTIHGEVKELGGFLSGDGRTFKILEEMMASPEVVHFGRWEQGDIGINNNRGLLTKRWRLIPAPQDDNIFAPLGQAELGFFDALISTNKFLIYQTTIWDVFQEMCLRHPSYIASSVPYEGKYGPRMTMFFGLPDQLYFARDSSHKEDQVVSALKNVVKQGHKDDASAAAIDDIRDSNFELDAETLDEMMNEELFKKTASERDRWFQILNKMYALDKGFIRPFRSYHLLTSSMHILHNSLSSSAHNTFNTVTLQYGEDSPKIDSDTAELNFENLETFTLRADEAIPDEEAREMFAQYPNCVGFEQAKQYSVSLLFNSLKEAYKGSVITIGNPKIKPYDICYIFDEYTDMFGPIEVEQVVHRFSQETGFITEITPDLLVHVNQHSTLSTSDAMGLMAEHAIRSIGIPSIPALAATALTGPALAISNLAFSPIATMVFNSSENSLGQSGPNTMFGMLGAFIFRKLITRTQLAHPFRYSPLVLGGRPMIGGLPNRRSDGTFIQKAEKWFKDSEEGIGLLLDDTMDRVNPNNWLGQLGEGDWKTVFPGGS